MAKIGRIVARNKRDKTIEAEQTMEDGTETENNNPFLSVSGLILNIVISILLLGFPILRHEQRKRASVS